MSIPKGWEEVRLGDICSDVIGGGTPSTKNSKFWQGDIPWISSSDLIDESIYHIDTTRFITQEAIDKSATKLIPKNSVIVVTRVGLGKLAINDKELCTSQDFQSLIFKNQNYLFMAYAIKHNIYDTIKIMQGTSIKGITKEQLKSMKIKLPPLKEQEKIAEILSSCDEHIKNLKNLKSELEKEKLHLMNELLSGKTRFANFTTPWQEVKLADICDIQKGQQLNKLNLQENGKFPVINGGIEPSGYYDEFNTQENTITISEGGNSCGYVNFLTTKFWSGGHCYTLQNVKIDNKFLYFYLKYQEKDIMKLRLGSGLPNIQKGSISAVIIKYPSLEEQKKIGEVLSVCDERLQCLNELITAQTTLKSHLLTELLTGNLRVKDY